MTKPRLVRQFLDLARVRWSPVDLFSPRLPTRVGGPSPRGCLAYGFDEEQRVGSLVMFDALSRDERLLLLRFACAFAWTDLEVTEKERAFVRRLVAKMELVADEAAEVEHWLAVAPSPGDVDPKQVPSEHRKAFVETIRALIYADGKVDPEEREQFERLKAAIG
jgi:uncharacterized tellurite resistance protein B-like protein